jgi:hypothetical protein
MKEAIMFKVDEAIPNPSLDSFEAWEHQVKEPNERNVFSALSDKKWDFRTVEGISRDTGICESEIRQIIGKYPQWFRKSLALDREGRELFTMRSKPVKLREHLAGIQRFLGILFK